MAMKRKTLYQLTEEMLMLRDLVDGAINPDTGEIDIDDPALKEFTEAQFETEEKIQGYVRFMKILEKHALDAESEYKNLKAMIEESRDAAKSARNEINGLRFLVLRYMQAMNQKEIIAGPFRIKRGWPRHAVIVPDYADYLSWRDEFYKTEFKPDKKALLSAHKAGLPLPQGVEVKQSERIEIK